MNRPAAWIPCPDCDEFWCTLHNEHVHDCDCPALEEWVEQGQDPYEPGTGKGVSTGADGNIIICPRGEA